MSRRKKQDPIFLPVYIDDAGKNTFQPFRLVRVDEEKDGVKTPTLKVVDNEKAKDKYGEDYIKPMNRKSRRIKEKQLKVYERKYGPKIPVAGLVDRPFSLEFNGSASEKQ